LLSLVERGFAPRQKRGDDKAVGHGFTLHDHEGFAIVLFSQGEQFIRVSSNDSFRFGNRFQNVKPLTREFGVFFRDVRPSFVGQPDCHAVLRCRRFGHWNLFLPMHLRRDFQAQRVEPDEAGTANVIRQLHNVGVVVSSKTTVD
jgi:hypothetical protein